MEKIVKFTIAISWICRTHLSREDIQCRKLAIAHARFCFSTTVAHLLLDDIEHVVAYFAPI